MHITLALRKQKEKKGNLVTHPTIAQTNKRVITAGTPVLRMLVVHINNDSISFLVHVYTVHACVCMFVQSCVCMYQADEGAQDHDHE